MQKKKKKKKKKKKNIPIFFFDKNEKKKKKKKLVQSKTLQQSLFVLISGFDSLGRFLWITYCFLMKCK